MQHVPCPLPVQAFPAPPHEPLVVHTHPSPWHIELEVYPSQEPVNVPVHVSTPVQVQGITPLTCGVRHMLCTVCPVQQSPPPEQYHT